MAPGKQVKRSFGVIEDQAKKIQYVPPQQTAIGSGWVGDNREASFDEHRDIIGPKQTEMSFDVVDVEISSPTRKLFGLKRRKPQEFEVSSMQHRAIGAGIDEEGDLFPIPGRGSHFTANGGPQYAVRIAGPFTGYEH